MAIVNLSAQWYTYYQKVKALFAEDPEVSVMYDDKDRKLRLYVDNESKAKALEQLMPSTVDFGNGSINVCVIPGNPVLNESEGYSLLETALRGNDAVNYIKTVSMYGGVFTYVVFRKEVVQYFNDDLTDIEGKCSTLYEDLAREVLSRACRSNREYSGVFFCTDST